MTAKSKRKNQSRSGLSYWWNEFLFTKSLDDHVHIIQIGLGIN